MRNPAARDGTLHQMQQGVTGTFAVIGESSGLRIVTDSKGVIRARCARQAAAATALIPGWATTPWSSCTGR